MQAAQIHRRAGALLFVVAAAALAVAATLVLSNHHAAPSRAVRLVGPGAAPPTVQQPVTQQRVFGSKASPQQVAEQAEGLVNSLPPLTEADFHAPVSAYRSYALHLATTFDRDTRALTAALRSGDRTAAEAAWQRADSSFARIGAAYGALGAIGDAVDGAPGGLQLGTADPHFVGLQRIEYGLWTDQPVHSLVRYGRRLQADLVPLRQALRDNPVSALTYATRAHEILEDVQRDRLTTQTPSGSGVRATADGVAATRVVLQTLSPLLNGRGDALQESRVSLGQLSAALALIRHDHGGHYPSLSRLSRYEHELLDGRLGEALEALDGIPGELETRGPPTFARIP